MKIVSKIIGVFGIVLSLCGIANADVISLSSHNLGNGIQQTYGTINGQPVSLSTYNLGNGITQTYGNVGNQSVSLNTYNFNNGYSQTYGNVNDYGYGNYGNCNNVLDESLYLNYLEE